MPAAALAQIAHVQRELAVAVHAVSPRPSLLEQTQQSLIVLGARAGRLALPSVITAVVNLQTHAHAPYAVLTFVPLDKCVLHPDCLAKYAAAFFKMPLSSVTRLSSAFNLHNSSA